MKEAPFFPSTVQQLSYNAKFGSHLHCCGQSFLQPDNLNRPLLNTQWHGVWPNMSHSCQVEVAKGMLSSGSRDVWVILWVVHKLAFASRFQPYFWNKMLKGEKHPQMNDARRCELCVVNKCHLVPAGTVSVVMCCLMCSSLDSDVKG